jgi:hypothetical protein
VSQLFVSHSSRDNFAAKALAEWLAAEGFNDIFLDLDPERGIAAGERWERALNQATLRCEAVLFLVSKAWLESRWCWKEHSLARGKNKKLFAALIDETMTIGDLPSELTGTWQVVDLVHGVPTRTFRVQLSGSDAEQHIDLAEAGLIRLRAGLTRAGLDPKYFAWPPEGEPNRPPYPGLSALEASDAGIFFGRDAPLVEAMDKLRGLALGAAPRLYVILGASGAGKSSFLRAGLLPRLQRDDRQFLPLSPLRPERSPILGENGLLGALVKAFPTETRASLRAFADAGAEALRPLLKRAAAEAQSRITVADAAAKPPTMVIAIDQAEELFSAESAAEGTRLLDTLATLAAVDDPTVVVIFAIRSDSYDQLQRAKPLAELPQQTQSLPPMPRGEYARVIEGPSERVATAGGKLRIDPRLTQALLSDLVQGGGADVLPLLAFTLEHLWREFSAAGTITLENYVATGGIGGVIDRAVRRAFGAADVDPRIPRDPQEREKLLRKGLIPWLAGVDPETKTPRRAIARREDLPEDTRPLLDLLVSERLLRSDAREEPGPDGTARTVATLEPAHEALLRQWAPLKGWLEADLGRLATLEGVKRAARDWDANGRNAAWLAHHGLRLVDAVSLDERSDLAAKLDALDRAYLAGCGTREASEAAEAEARRREREEGQAKTLRDAQDLAAANKRIARRTLVGLLAASVFAISAGAGAYLARQQRAEAEQQRTLAQERQIEAEAAKANAQKRQTEAEEAKAAAQAETRKATQRSAILAAGAATGLANEGSTDAALLLLLDGARWFDNDNVPDEIRIAFTNALQKGEHVTIAPIPPNAQMNVFRSAIALTDNSEHDFRIIKSKAEPASLRNLDKNDADISLILEGAGDDNLFVLRKDFNLERVDLNTLTIGGVGAFPYPRLGRQFKSERIVSFPDANVVVRILQDDSSKDSGAQGPSGKETYIQIYDLTKNITFEGGIKTDDEIKSFERYNRISRFGGELFFIENSQGSADEARAYRIDFSNHQLVLVPIDLSNKDNDAKSTTIRYGECIGRMTAAEQALAMKWISNLAPSDFYRCGKIGSNYIIRITNGSSVGDVTSYVVIYSDQEGRNPKILDLQKIIADDGLKGNPRWVGMYPNSNLVAAIVNRDVLIYNEYGEGTRFKFPTPPSSALFIDPLKLVVAEDAIGHLDIIDLGEPTKRDSLSSRQQFIGQATANHTFHHGDCNSTPEMEKEALPGGRVIRFRHADRAQSVLMEITGEGLNEAVDLGPVSGCVSISPDWKRMLVRSAAESAEKRVRIYDFDKVLSFGRLEGAALRTLPVDSPSSAFFVGSTEDIVTTDGGNRVIRWSYRDEQWISQELYHGDNPVFYAEPNDTGNLLIILEYLSGGTVVGTLYSVKAGKIWYELGSDYKWLGATFINPTDIGVSKGQKWVNVFPVLSLEELKNLAERNLSPHCHLYTGTDYRGSKCWPATLNDRN